VQAPSLELLQQGKLSECLYDNSEASEQEVQDLAHNVSLFSIYLEELDGVLCQGELHYKPQLQRAAQRNGIMATEL